MIFNMKIVLWFWVTNRNDFDFEIVTNICHAMIFISILNYWPQRFWFWTINGTDFDFELLTATISILNYYINRTEFDFELLTARILILSY